MTVVRVDKDEVELTLTFVAEFEASAERVWQVWADPRQLERWWGPPSWPATFERHDFVVGGESRYVMTGPEGQQSRGWWMITALQPPHRLEFDDGFIGDDGKPVSAPAPTHAVVTIEDLDTADHRTRARMTMVSRFASIEQLEQVLAMGAEKALRLALGQLDDLLV
jgi:uncharacterized protein YndB with AHSA1/START domain